MAKNCGEWGRDKAKERYADGGRIYGVDEQNRDSGLKEMSRRFDADKRMGAGYQSRDKSESVYISDSVPRKGGK